MSDTLERPPRPEGLLLIGPEGRTYVALDPNNLIVAEDDVVHGYGVRTTHVSMAIPAAESEPEVAGRDMVNGVWHTWWRLGWIYDEYGDLVHVWHYHPYGTAFAIYQV